VALTDPVITLAGLCQIDLPSHTIRLCDGAFVDWGGNRFDSQDATFGTIESVDQVSEAVSDEAPSGKLTMLPPSAASAADLFQPNAQGSPMSFWLAEVNPATGLVVGTPELLFSGFLDNLRLIVGKSRRAVEIEFMSAAERLFWTKEGNVLSSRFHNEVWPGETGLDQATGVQIAVAWGTSSPSRGTISVGSSGSGGGNGLGGALGTIFGGRGGASRQ
jgi:hypothetical protein